MIIMVTVIISKGLGLGQMMVNQITLNQQAQLFCCPEMKEAPVLLSIRQQKKNNCRVESGYIPLAEVLQTFLFDSLSD